MTEIRLTDNDFDKLFFHLSESFKSLEEISNLVTQSLNIKPKTKPSPQQDINHSNYNLQSNSGNDRITNQSSLLMMALAAILHDRVLLPTVSSFSKFD